MANYADKRKKKLKTSRASSGAQLFMSDAEKERMLNRPFGGTEIENLINKSVTNKMLEEKMTPQESGKLKAETFVDMLDRAYDLDKPRVAKKKYGGKVAKMKDGGKVGLYGKMSQDNVGVYRALSDDEIAERKKRAKLKAKLKKEANMRAQHRRDKQFFEDFENADKNDDMIRGNLIGKHADDTRSISQYGTDAQAGRSFGQKTRGKQSDMITKKAKGGAVRKYRGGGMVEGYEYGGEVSGSCRGGGAALRGTKFSGCK